MRKAFVQSMLDLMSKNEKVVLLIGDIGAYLLRDVAENYPDRLINAGISEANMMSMAAAMALDGWVPYVYTIADFVTSRCYDQIRVSVVVNNANVKIVGVGSGVSYSHLGSSHHSIEDISIMRSLQNMCVLSPADGEDTYQAVFAASEHLGPVYLRLTVDAEPLRGNNKKVLRIGKSREIMPGKHYTFICTGEVTREALLAAERLHEEGIDVRVINMYSIKPLDRAAVIKAAEDTKGIFTIEEHSVTGGLGSAVAECLLENGVKNNFFFKRIGISENKVKLYGTKQRLLKELKLDAEGIHNTVMSFLPKRKKQ